MGGNEPGYNFDFEVQELDATYRAVGADPDAVVKRAKVGRPVKLIVAAVDRDGRGWLVRVLSRSVLIPGGDERDARQLADDGFGVRSICRTFLTDEAEQQRLQRIMADHDSASWTFAFRTIWK